jgi:hypothetical protein
MVSLVFGSGELLLRVQAHRHGGGLRPDRAMTWLQLATLGLAAAWNLMTDVLGLGRGSPRARRPARFTLTESSEASPRAPHALLVWLAELAAG